MRALLFSLVISVQAFFSCSTPSSILGISEQEENNKKVAVSYFEELVNKRKLELVNEIFSPNFISHNMDGKQSNSIKDNVLVPYLQRLYKAFPDFTYMVNEAIAEGNKVAIYVTVTGTHMEEFLGAKASGNKVVYKEMYIFKMEEGKIVEGWVVADLDGLKKGLLKQ